MKDWTLRMFHKYVESEIDGRVFLAVLALCSLALSAWLGWLELAVGLIVLAAGAYGYWRMRAAPDEGDKGLAVFLMLLMGAAQALVSVVWLLARAMV